VTRWRFPAHNGSLRQERVARLFEVDANHKAGWRKPRPGRLSSSPGCVWATTGDTLCAPGHPLWLERIETREPVLGLAIEPQSSADEEKLLEALDKLQQEDPTLRVEEDAETGQRVLRGMGELHLQIAGERLRREFNVNIRVGHPDVVTRETIERRPKPITCFIGDRAARWQETGDESLGAGGGGTVARVGRGHRVGGTAGAPEGVDLSSQREAIAGGAGDVLASGPATGAPLQDLTGAGAGGGAVRRPVQPAGAAHCRWRRRRARRCCGRAVWFCGRSWRPRWWFPKAMSAR
jgi:elongation factor G